MYQRLPSWVLGFHGTDEQTVQEILNDPKSSLLFQANDYDWLGNGAYFWENDPARALSFSQERMRWKKITGNKPAVIGAVIDLGLCLNLFDQPALDEVRDAYEDLAFDFQLMSKELPTNEGRTPDRVMRYRDCAVIQHLHQLRQDVLQIEPYNTVRCPFPEGSELYEGAGFRAKNHIQIAVRDPKQIRGYFLPRD